MRGEWAGSGAAGGEKPASEQVQFTEPVSLADSVEQKHPEFPSSQS